MKRFFFVFIIMFNCLLCSAQLLLGVQGGINFAKLKIAHHGYYYTADISSTKTGLIAGFVVQTPIIPHLDFRPELNYIQKGGKFYIESYNNRIGEKSSVNDAKFDYIQLCLNTVYKIKVSKSISCFIGGGLDLNFGFGGKVKAVTTYNSTQNMPPYSLNEELKQNGSNDIGVSLISGINLKNGLFASLKYSRDFMDVNNFSTKDDYGIITTRGFAFNVGYMFTKRSLLFVRKSKK